MARLPIGLGEIEAFFAVAETNSFSLAASRLAISQSAVSARIRTAEALLGVSLFHRTTRRVTLTENGARLKARVGRALTELKDVFEELDDEARLARGHVRIGATPTISTIFVPDIIRKFGVRYPGIKIDMQDDFYGEALYRVGRGEVDFGLMPANADFNPIEVDFEEVMTERWLLLTPKDHPLMQLESVGIPEINAYPIVSMPPHSALHAQLKAEFLADGLHFSPAVCTMHFFTVIAQVKADQGVAIFPEGLRDYVRHEEFGFRRIDRGIHGRKIVLATARDRSHSPPVLALMNFIREYYAEDAPRPLT